MGMLCPICKTHQPFQRHITADGKGAEKAEQVLFSILACGHQVGGPGFKDYQEQVNQIDVDTAVKIDALRRKAADQKAALYHKMAAKKEG
jgi:hypothetical protein